VTPTDGLRHCYWAHADAQTWTDARQTCINQGGQLVSILSATENTFVVSVAQFSQNYQDAWIGATDNKAGNDATGPGIYHWVTGEPWGFTRWAPGQPDGFCDPCPAGQPNCTRTCDHRGTLVSDGTWSDRWQDNPRGFVCEATVP
jgi:hypothetical protein